MIVTPMKRPDFDKLCADTFALLGAKFDSPAARALLWAIGRQEGRMFRRRQMGGPARGLWQFERGGGVRGVLTHPASKAHALRVCAARGVDAIAAAVYPRLEHDDLLACCFARLLLFTDPDPLPAPIAANEERAWRYYTDNWRPGSPHRDTWGDFWKEAVEMSR